MIWKLEKPHICESETGDLGGKRMYKVSMGLELSYWLGQATEWRTSQKDKKGTQELKQS